MGVGTTAIELIVTDGTNTVSCSFNIDVVNGTAASITCPADITESVDDFCEFTLPDYTTQATVSNDCSGTTSVSQSPVAGTIVPLGMTEITLTLDDGGVTSDCTFNVIVADTTPPVAVCQDVTVQLDANGEASIVSLDIDGGSTDNCGNITFSISQTDFTCADLGDNSAPLDPLLITGVFDGPLPGGIPKGVELKVQEDIADLSLYGIGSANNGGGTDGEEFTFPAGSATAGDYIYITNNDVGFMDFFGFAANFTDSALEINGDDAVELFFNGAVIDTFGDINTDGSGQAWEFLDGWAYRMNEQTVNNGVFDAANWNYSGINAFDGETTNTTAATPFPIGTFINTPQAPDTVIVTLTVTDDAGNSDSCTAVVTVVDDMAPSITCPMDQMASVDTFCEFEIPDYTTSVMAMDNCAAVVNVTQDPAPGTLVTQGVTVVTIFADDGTNFTSCNFSVEIIDDIAPEITCPADITESADGGCEFIIPDYTGLATATDNCANPVSLFQSPVAGTPVGPGVTIITLTAFDGSLATDCMFNLTVVDDTPPVIVCPMDQTGMVDDNCEFEIQDYTVLANIVDNCSNPTVTQTPAAGTFVGAGTTIIEILVTDGTNTVSCSFNLIVADTIPPSLTCPNDQTASVDEFCEFILLDYTSLASASDNCATTVVLTQDPAPGTFVTQGTTIITIFADDGTNVTSCIFNLEVIDDIAPEITCPADITESADGGCEFIIPDYTGLATATDNCTNPVSLFQSPVAGTPVGPGVTVITLTAFDGSLATDCMFNLTVVDDTPPVIVCPMDQTGMVDNNCEFEVQDYTVLANIVDNCSNPTVTQTPAAGTFVGAGTTLIEILVTDGTNTVSCSFNLIVADNIPPIVDCPVTQTESLDANCEFIIPDYSALVTASDNCGMVTITQTPAIGTIVVLGTTTIDIVVSDGSNSDSCSFDINVVDDTAPMAVCQNINVVLDAMGMATITAADVDGGSADNCGNITTSIDIDTFTCANVGTNDVVLTVTDDEGNVSMCTAIVTVLDEMAPMAVCQDITIMLDANGMASIVASDVDGGSTDNCVINTLAVDIDMFDCSNVGANVVTLTVTDVNGNASTCTATVTVEELNAMPNAVCQNITVPLMQDGTAMITPSTIDGGSTGAGCIDGLTIDINMFDCSNIGTPVEVTLTVTNGAGATDSCIALVNVVDGFAPEVICPADQTIVVPIPYLLPDYFATGEATATDNCTNPITVFDQDPAPGTPLQPGTYNITLSAQDDNGFEDECTFELIIEELLGTEDSQLSLATVLLYPNPATDKVIISNPKLINLETISVFDIEGRLVLKEALDAVEATTIDVSPLQSATYFVVINGKQGQITKQLMIE